MFIQLKGVALKFFAEFLFWVVFNSVQFYLSRQLTQENHGIVEALGEGGVLPYMGLTVCAAVKGNGFQAVYSGIGYINQRR